MKNRVAILAGVVWHQYANLVFSTHLDFRWEGQGDDPSLPPGVVGARPARGPPPLHGYEDIELEPLAEPR